MPDSRVREAVKELKKNYDKFQDIISKLGNKKSLVGLTESEEKLLKQLNKTSDKILSILIY